MLGKERKGINEELGRLTTIADLPPKSVLVGYIKKAAALNDAGVKVERARTPPKPVRVPADLAGALQKNTRALAAFENFPPSHKREYTEWITEAKTDDTRTRRLRQAIEWIAEGKSRNWKYEKKNRDWGLGIGAPWGLGDLGTRGLGTRGLGDSGTGGLGDSLSALPRGRRVCRRVGQRYRVASDHEVLSETRIDVIRLPEIETAHVETIHQRRRQRLDDSNQHSGDRTPMVPE